MYIGSITEQFPLYGSRYVVGLGDVPTYRGVQTKTLERYRCDYCGHECRVLGRADESFYCPTCQRLIDIAPLEELG